MAYRTCHDPSDLVDRLRPESERHQYMCLSGRQEDESTDSVFGLKGVLKSTFSLHQCFYIRFSKNVQLLCASDEVAFVLTEAELRTFSSFAFLLLSALSFWV